MFCRKCGEKLTEGSRFCNRCGTPIHSVSKFSFKIIGGIILIIMLSIIVAIKLGNRSDYTQSYSNGNIAIDDNSAVIEKSMFSQLSISNIEVKFDHGDWSRIYATIKNDGDCPVSGYLKAVVYHNGNM